MTMHRRARHRVLGGLVVTALLLGACSSDDGAEPDAASDTADDTGDANDGEDAADDGGDADDGAADGDAVTIEYFSFSANDTLDTLEAIVDAFEAENPDVDVEVVSTSYDDYWTRLQTRIAGGQAPDAFELNYENFVAYARAGALLDPSTVAGSAIDPSRFYGGAAEAFQLDGIQYGLPASFVNVVLYYNQDLFDAAGLDYPDASWTWEDELAAAEQLTDADAGVWGTYQPVSFHEFFKVLAQNGGEFFDADGQPAFDSPQGVEAAQWLIDRVGTVSPTDAELGDQPNEAVFAEGRIAMWHNGIWHFGAMQDLDFAWDIAVEPGNTNKASHFFADGVVASATTEHPEAAVRWMQFLAGSDASVETRLAASWGLPAIADTSLLAPYLEQTPPANRQAVFDSLEAVVVPPVIEAQQQMQDIVSQALERALLGQVDVEQALSEAADQVAALVN